MYVGTHWVCVYVLAHAILRYFALPALHRGIWWCPPVFSVHDEQTVCTCTWYRSTYTYLYVCMYVCICCQDTCHTPGPQWRSSSWLVFQTVMFAMPSYSCTLGIQCTCSTHTVWRWMYYILHLRMQSFQTFWFYSYVHTYIAYCNHWLIIVLERRSLTLYTIGIHVRLRRSNNHVSIQCTNRTRHPEATVRMYVRTM